MPKSKRPPGWKWRGLRARLRYDMETEGGHRFAGGTEMTVVTAWRGHLTLQDADGRYIRFVSPRAVTFLDPLLTEASYDAKYGRN